MDCNYTFPPDLAPNCFVPNQSNFIMYFISLFCYVICRPISAFLPEISRFSRYFKFPTRTNALSISMIKFNVIFTVLGATEETEKYKLAKSCLWDTFQSILGYLEWHTKRNSTVDKISTIADLAEHMGRFSWYYNC